MNSPRYLHLLNKLKKFCSDKERCLRDVTLKIQRLNAEEFKGKIIEDLLKDNFLNENRFIQLYCQSKINNHKWGYEKIKANLITKEIPCEKIYEFFEKTEMDIYTRNLKEILSQKYETLKNARKDTIFARLMRFGISKGYEQEIVHRQLIELLDVQPSQDFEI